MFELIEFLFDISIFKEEFYIFELYIFSGLLEIFEVISLDG